MTIENLKIKYKEFQKKWNMELKNKAVEFAVGTEGIGGSHTIYNMQTGKYTKPAIPKLYANIIAETITEYIIDDFEIDISDKNEEIIHDLHFLPSIEIKKEEIFKRIKEIRDELDGNEYCNIGKIIDYPQSIFSESIVEELYPKFSPVLKRDVHERIERGDKNIDKCALRELTQDIYLIHDTNLLIIESEILNIHYSELSNNGTSNKILQKKPNPYPLVFSSSITFELFMYCISEYQNGDITPSLFAKFYLLFKERDYIIGHKYKPYKKFVINEFNVEPSRARTDRSLEPYDNHFLNFIRNFKNLKDIKTIE